MKKRCISISGLNSAASLNLNRLSLERVSMYVQAAYCTTIVLGFIAKLQRAFNKVLILVNESYFV